ncbi:MAG TPA: response regulator [Bacteroidia bacterium]|jgi:two-component system OmpR family response regulator|nr:response regulator [Bacteroidia bacterium]
MNFIKKLFETKSHKTGIVFIVEDNTAYAKTLAAFIRTSFSAVKEVAIFPVGETCITELDRNPDLIIMDYFLDTRYTDAETGLEIIKQIRAMRPEMNILLLSSQKDVDIMLETIRTYKCSYVKKDEKTFERVEEILKEAL